MADADVRWLQRLDNYGRALGALQRAVNTAHQRPLSELEEQGLSGVSGSRDAVREAVVRELQSTMQRRAMQR